MRFDSARRDSVVSSRMRRSEGCCGGRVERGLRGEEWVVERAIVGGGGRFSLVTVVGSFVVEMCFREEVRMGVMGIRARDFSWVWRLMSFFSKRGIRDVSFS